MAITQYDDEIDKLYDKDFRQIDFDYKRYVRVVERVNNKEPRSEELRKMISRDNFKHIPNGVYYFAFKNKVLIPHVIFRSYDILVIGYLVKSDKEKDNYAYYQVFNPMHDNVAYGARDCVIALYDNYHYGIGLDTELARENLELKMFDKYRNQILQIASKSIKQKEK